MGAKGDNDSVPQVVAAAYDGSSVLFKALRACGWGPLLNLGYYPLWNPASWLDVPGSQMRLVRRALDLARLQPGDHVLDVACGRGKSSHMASHRVGTSGRVLGLDLLPQNVSTASWLYVGSEHSDGGDSLSYVEGDAHNLHKHPGVLALSPSVIICIEAAFHFDRAAFLSSAARVLAPGGRLIVVDFAWREAAAAGVREGKLDPVAMEATRNCWQFEDFATEQEYRQLAAGAGLAVTAVHDWTSNVTSFNSLLLQSVAILSRMSATRALLRLVFPDLLLPLREWAELAEECTLQAVACRHMRYLAYVFEHTTA